MPARYSDSIRAAFSSERPLRVLFLGQINLRKGVGQLLEAVELLTGENVEFWFVGPTQIDVPQSLRMHPQVRWFGVAPRVEVVELLPGCGRVYFSDAFRWFWIDAVGSAVVEIAGDCVALLRRSCAR